MSTKYLRKIILEELKEVLKEVVVPAGISIGKKTKKDYLKSLIPGKSQKIFYPTIQNTQKNAKKVLSAIKGRSIIAGYTPCGNEIVGLKKGCMGKGVLKLQSMLKTAHDNMSATTVQTKEPEIDGYFGPKTETSLNSFLKLSYMPPLTGAITDDILDNSLLAAAVPDDFNQRYDVAHQQLVKDYSGQNQAPATTGPQSEPDVQISPSTEEERRKREEAEEVAKKKAKERGLDINLQESLIRKEITKLLKKL